MSLRSALGLYAVAAAIFLVLDLVWLTLVAARLYAHFLGDLLADSPNVVAASPPTGPGTPCGADHTRSGA